MITKNEDHDEYMKIQDGIFFPSSLHDIETKDTLAANNLADPNLLFPLLALLYLVQEVEDKYVLYEEDLYELTYRYLSDNKDNALYENVICTKVGATYHCPILDIYLRLWKVMEYVVYRPINKSLSLHISTETVAKSCDEKDLALANVLFDNYLVEIFESRGL